MNKTLTSLLIALALTAAPDLRAQETYYVYNGTMLQTVRDDPHRASCNHWEVWLLKTDGNSSNRSSRWGLLWGNSAEKVMKDLKWRQDFEVRYNKWRKSPSLHDYPDTHFNPVGPICVTDTAFEAKPGVLQTLDKIGDLADRMSKVITKIQPFLEIDLGLRESNPAKPYYLGSNLKQYLDVISKNIKQISKVYNRQADVLGPSVQEINFELEQLNQAVRQSENNVTRITGALSGAAPPITTVTHSSSAWSGQRVEVNGAQIIQNISVSGDQVTISQGDARTSLGQTYTVPKADLSASATSLRQQGTAWILSVVMPRRSVKLHINNGAGQDESVSRFELFFASEADARAAAQTLAGGAGH